MTKLEGMLGLCARAGKLVYGADMAEDAAKHGKVKLLIVDGSASENTKKQINDAGRYSGTPVIETECGMLGAAVGKPGRMAAAVTDSGFAKKMCEIAIKAGVQGVNDQN